MVRYTTIRQYIEIIATFYLIFNNILSNEEKNRKNLIFFTFVFWWERHYKNQFRNVTKT